MCLPKAKERERERVHLPGRLLRTSTRSRVSSSCYPGTRSTSSSCRLRRQDVVYICLFSAHNKNIYSDFSFYTFSFWLNSVYRNFLFYPFFFCLCLYCGHCYAQISLRRNIRKKKVVTRIPLRRHIKKGKVLIKD